MWLFEVIIDLLCAWLVVFAVDMAIGAVAEWMVKRRMRRAIEGWLRETNNTSANAVIDGEGR